MRPEQIEAIARKMEASIRGTTMTMEEAREVAIRFLRIMQHCVQPMKIEVDTTLRPGIVELAKRWG